MAEPRIWTELLTYGLGVALSPIHIVLLLLRSSPLLRGGMFVGGWLTSALAVIGLLTLGHALLLLDMPHGSDHRTGLDLIGGGALIALCGRELSEGCWMKEQRPLGAAPWIVSPQCRFPCCC